jgi:hypothetical protein
VQQLLLLLLLLQQEDLHKLLLLPGLAAVPCSSIVRPCALAPAHLLGGLLLLLL